MPPLRHVVPIAVFVTVILGLTACDSRPATETPAPPTPQPGVAEVTPAPAPRPEPASRREARPADAFVDSIGVNTHLHYLDTNYAQFDETVRPRLRELGTRHIRDGVVAREKIRALGQDGIWLMPLAGSDEWKSLGDLAPLLSGLEGPNETDLFAFTYKGAAFPEGTRAFMKDFHAFAKSDPALKTLTVLAPSTGRPGGGNVLGLVPCDAGNLHSYAGGRPPETPEILGKFTRPARSVAGDGKVFYATECGYHTLADGFESWAQPGVSEQAAAKYIARLLLHNFRAGIRRSYLYELLDTVSPTNKSLDGKGSESRYGLVRADGTPKPAFTAVRNLIALLADPGADTLPAALDYELRHGDGVESLLLHKQDGSFYLALWQPAVSFDLSKKKDVAIPDRKITIVLPEAAERVEIFRPVESDQPLSTLTAAREIPVSVPDHPVLVRIQPAPKAPALPDLVLEEFTLVPSASANGPLEFRAVVANKGNAEVPAGTAIGVTAMEEGEKNGPASTRRMGTFGTVQSGLAPGDSVEIRSNGPKWRPGPGVVRVIVLVDDVDRIEESSEKNNSRELTLP